MKISITEKQYIKNILNEEENIYYAPSKANGENMQVLWNKIFQKQKELNDEIFNELDDLTKKKAELFQNTLGVKLKDSGRDDNLSKIPHIMMNAGNNKVPQNVLVINITSALACPSFYLGTCCIKGSLCYAQQGENYQWHNVAAKNFKTDLMNTELLRKYQKGNKEPMRKYFSLVEMYINVGNAAAKNIYRKYIEQLEKKGVKLNDNELNGIREIANMCKITDIRLNEAGDFPCQLSVDLWSKFAKKLKRKYNINVHAYTARYLDFSKTPDSFSVMPSHDNINIGNEQFRSFRAIDKSSYDALKGGEQLDKNGQPILGTLPNGEKFYKCPCVKGKSECGMCGVCRRKNMTGVPYTIYVELHAQKYASGLKMLYKTDEMSSIVNNYKELNWASDKEKETANRRPKLNATKQLDANIDKLRGNKKG